MRALSLTLFILLTASPVLAQEGPPESVENAPETAEPSEDTEVRVDVIPMLANDVAPFDGLLVPEKRFNEFLDAEVKVEELERKREVDKKISDRVEETCYKQLDKATEPIPWYKTPSSNRWFGFAIGVVVTALAVYGGTKILKATDE